MPRSRLKLQPLDLGKATIGQRLARLREKHSFCQVELAEESGLTQSLAFDSERGRIWLNAEVLAGFALAIAVSAGEIISRHASTSTGRPESRRIQGRRQALEELPKRDQAALLRTIDAVLAKTR